MFKALPYLLAVTMLVFISRVTATELITHQVPSSVFTEAQTIKVSQPKYYSAEQSYPVIYVLNTGDFYQGDYQTDILQRIRQSEGYQRLPASLVVFIDNATWYQTLFNNSDALNTYITTELPKFIEKKYKVREKILISHSYAAAYLLKQSPQLQLGYDQLIAISVVFPNVAYVQETAKQLKQLNSQQASVSVFQEQGHFADLQLLETKGQQFQVTTIADHNHQSVVPIAVSKALRAIFYDFEITDYLSSQQLTKSEYKQQFLTIRKKYHLDTSEQDIQSFYRGVAQELMKQQRLELAFELWQDANPRFRHYFINRWGDRFLAQGKLALARYTWQQLSKFYPHSPFAWHKLIELGKQTGNTSEQHTALQGLTQAVNSFTLSDHGMFIAFATSHGEQYPQLSLSALKRITEQAPKHKEAWQQLVIHYKQLGKMDLANSAQQVLNNL